MQYCPVVSLCPFSPERPTVIAGGGGAPRTRTRRHALLIMAIIIDCLSGAVSLT